MHATTPNKKTNKQNPTPLLLLFCFACGPKPPVRTALEGDLAALRHDIAQAQAEHSLSDARVADLAQAVATREIWSTEGALGAARVRSLRGCQGALTGILEKRAKGDDDVAAEATVALLELHRVNAETMIERYSNTTQPSFRALAARAATRPGDSALRLRFYADADQRVRRGALVSAVAARQPSELAALLEAGRLDPEPVNCSLAVRAAGAIGGEQAVLGLKDLWARADATLRLAIVDAWAEPASLRAGGARELAVAADQNASLASISAAYELSRANGDEAASGVARLVRALGPGVADERRLALALVPLNDESLPAIRKLTSDADLALAVAAYGRLLAVPSEHAQVLDALRKIAGRESHSATERRSIDDARSLLAAEGEQSLAASFVAELSAKAPESRHRAASALIQLARLSDAATALADADPDVRSSVACEILSKRARD
jgi:hypothetical protein